MVQDEVMENKPSTLIAAERKQLETLLAKGKLPAKVFKRATALLELDRGKTISAVAQTRTLRYPTVRAWRDSSLQQGRKCLHAAPRSGRPSVIDGPQRAKVTARACSEAPQDTPAGVCACWPRRSSSWDMVTLCHITQVGNILKKTC